MLSRIILAVVVGIVAYLVCELVGGLLATTAIDFAVTIGNFLQKYASLIGLLSALWFFFSGRTTLRP